MRRAIAKQCNGTNESRVFSTSKSSVPCRTSDLGDGIRSFRRSRGKKGAYQIPVGRQQEFCCSARRRRRLAESAANKKVARISDGRLEWESALPNNAPSTNLPCDRITARLR